jgi:hypothetical protein
MKIGVMQPYIFPYLGYFKLVNSVDKFVFFDDVHYKKKGWINRNNLIFSGRVAQFTIPLKDASQNRLINEIFISLDDAWKKKLKASLRQSYSKAPYFHDVFEMIREVVFGEELLISEMAKKSIIEVSKYLQLEANFVNSSCGYNNEAIKGEERILDICQKECATEYINLPGGQDLYDETSFAKYGIQLSFINANFPVYSQFSKSFQPGLSIIDILMHNKPEDIRKMLK